jgi:pimeloyl-ACP methyl ester carboxylesterase
MRLKTRSWGVPGTGSLVCLHGVAHTGAIFEGLGRQLSARGTSVVALDLRGHGGSLREPPWNTATHVRDVLDTVEALGIERATWVGHSFGGRLVAELAAAAPERTERLVMLDPGLEVSPARALQAAEIERLDWNFATPDGALNAMLSGFSMVAPDRELVAKWVREDVVEGPDGRYRFSFCPGAAVVAWSEVTLPAPPIAPVPTLMLAAERGLEGHAELGRRYRETLDGMLTTVIVPHGHNLLWESPDETIAAIEKFVAS